MRRSRKRPLYMNACVPQQWSRLSRIHRQWSRLSRIHDKWLRLSRIHRQWSRLLRIHDKWSRLSRIHEQWSRIHEQWLTLSRIHISTHLRNGFFGMRRSVHCWKARISFSAKVDGLSRPCGTWYDFLPVQSVCICTLSLSKI